MKVSRFIRTVIHLRPIQVFYQVKNRLIKPKYVQLIAPNVLIPCFKTQPIAKNQCVYGKTFSFLNLEHEYAGWDYTANGMLWAYNQNYFDWINQEGITAVDGCEWIDMFIAEVKDGFPMDPYPIALRSINWVKFLCKYPDCATTVRLNSLYSQLRLLEKKLEYHLLGNHILEDAYALYINACFFNDEILYRKASKLLSKQLSEQVLADGAHYEQSPMYHCILLDRLLDCINITKIMIKSREEEVKCLSEYAGRMLGHLESVVWNDGTIPMLNDSAKGIAPAPKQLFDYAKRLGVEWKAIPMTESGYRKMNNGSIEVIVDVGNVTATYQPGHTHADVLNYELRIDGKPFVVDTGVSTYNKTERRQLERSTIAHNCVSINGKNSLEVWGGFRVGRRAIVSVKSEELTDNTYVIDASHDGYGTICRRRFELKDGSFSVEDWCNDDAISYIHLAKEADENRVKVDGACGVETQPWKYSVEYNKFIEGKVIKIRFKGHCKYTIQ